MPLSHQTRPQSPASMCKPGAKPTVARLGAGQALLDAVVRRGPAFLCVAAINPRAQAFSRRNGFRPDGSTKSDRIDEVRMVLA